MIEDANEEAQLTLFNNSDVPDRDSVVQSISVPNKLELAYKAIEQLQSIGIPISPEQTNCIANMEKDYLQSEVLPLVEQEVVPLVEKIQNSFNLEVSYNVADGYNVRVVDKNATPQQQPVSITDIPKRQKKYIIRVIFPDNHVSCHNMVWETLLDVVKYAGPRKVQGLGLNLMGIQFVSTELSDNYRLRVSQKEAEPGVYVCTYSSTDTKLEQIKTMNRQLNLGLRIEKVML